MSSSEVVAEALFRAHAEKATGWLTCVSRGRTSRLALRDGDLVGAELQFGFRAPLQGLLQAGRIELMQLDALWARGEAGRGDLEALEELGVSAEEEATRRLLSGVRRVAQLAERAVFEAGDVNGEEVVDGAQVVRTAFEAVHALSPEAPMCRVIDQERAAEWAVSPQERELLEGFVEFKSTGGLSAEQRVLFDVLRRSGALEALSPSEWERQQAEEQAQRRAREEREEEERRIEVERIEQVRHRAEEARLAEEKRQEEARLAELQRVEEARLAEEKREEEARLAEEKRQEEARLAEEKRKEEEQRAEEARLEEEARLADERRREEARQAEEARLAEEQRREDERKAREAREAEEARLAEEQRLEDERKAHEARLAAEREQEAAKKAEEARLAQEQKRREDEERAEAERVAEEERREEARRAEEAARLAEERRREEQRRAEEARLSEERKRAEELKAEEARLAEEMRAAAERRAEEAKALEARLAADRRAEEARQAEQKRAAAQRAAQSSRPPDERAPGAPSRPEVSTRPDAGAYAGAPGGDDDQEDRPRRPDEITQPRHVVSDTGLFRMQERERVEAERERAEAADRAEEQEVQVLKARASAPRPPAAPVDELGDKRRAEDGRLAQLKREAEELAQRADARRREGPTPSAPIPGSSPSAAGPVPMAQAVGGSSERDREILQKHHEKDELLKRMNEALRRSMSSGPATIPPVPAPLPLAQAVPPPSAPRPSGSMASRIFGGPEPTPSAQESDLWRLVGGAPASEPSPGATSFEEALRRVDSTLEQLVSNSGSAPEGAAGEEPIIEAELESPAQGLGEEDDLGDPSDPADAARQRRLRLLRKAMENLGSMPPRTPVSGVQVVPPTPESAPSQVGSPPPGAPPHGASQGVKSSPSSVGLDATIAEKQLAAQIEARFAALSGKRDHFAILGVQESASKDQVKAAFLNLAKVFHPDRLPASLKEHADKMSRVFEGIREAYEILNDDQKRASYLAAQKAAQGPTPSAQAVEFFKVGDAQFKKRDFKGAEENFGKAHAIDQGATSLAARAWAIYMDPTRKAEAVAARKMMADALKLDPTCDRAHYQLGVIARVEGDMDRAEKHFKEAIAKNPKHLEAAQELRLIEMRKKKGNLYNK